METLRRYFIDTEFYPDADGHSHLISTGLIAEDDKGPGFYAIAAEFNAAACTHPWINEHVVAKLDPAALHLDRAQMADAIIDYITPADNIEFWARNGSYDFYHLCQNFNTMDGLLDRLAAERNVKRAYFRDINEVLRAAGNPKLPKAPVDTAHISIVDATWDRDRFPEIERLAALHQARPVQLIQTLKVGFRAWLQGSKP
jgi:hypothetical protein